MRAAARQQLGCCRDLLRGVTARGVKWAMMLLGFTATEQRAQQIGLIAKPAQETFTFIDDPDGAEKCRRENPDALIIQIKIVHPPRCEYKPCKSPDCNCLGNYRLRMAEDLGFHAPSPTVH
jgi:hypothetical protein